MKLILYFPGSSLFALFACVQVPAPFAILEFIIKYFVCNSLLDSTFGLLLAFETLRKKQSRG